jgi:hypothetical protein
MPDRGPVGEPAPHAVRLIAHAAIKAAIFIFMNCPLEDLRV